MNRCPWCYANEKMIRYHDREWGVPVHRDRKMFEHLTMEVMQCGLSWNTVLQKREAIGQAFSAFDFNKVATYTEEDIKRALAVPDMIRSKRKVNAVVNNAARFLEVRKEFGTFCNYLWGWTGGKTILYMGHQKPGRMPASNGLSEEIARDLKRRGFKYVGPTNIYAHLQSTGLINDHLETCFRYKEIVDHYPCIRKRCRGEK